MGSINTSGSSVKRTTINRSINSIWESINYGYFVSVTATPFADLMSEFSNDFNVVKLTPPEEYTGIKFFNDSDIYKSMEGVTYAIEDEYYAHLAKAIARHTVNVKKFEDRFGTNEGTQFLVNTSLTKTEHGKIFESIKKIVNNMLSLNSDTLLAVLNNLDVASEISVGDFRKVLNSYSLVTINQENTDWDLTANSIVIGGSLLSRGYTFPKLLTCIMLNVPKDIISADTLMQRARWFGYRKEYSDLMNVYMSDKTIEAFKECEELNKIIFETDGKANLVSKIKDSDFEVIKPTGKDV